MPRVIDQSTTYFPPYDEADEDGIIAVGGDLAPERLLKAYKLGIFPWPHQDCPLLWFFPDPRYVLKPQELIIDRGLRKALKNTELTICADHDFARVIRSCQEIRRLKKDGTWITDDIIKSYQTLHQLGFAHSIEAYCDSKLVGGLYGISLGSIFFGESMFFTQANASKICFVTLAAHLALWRFSLIDCQMPTTTFKKFGASSVPKRDFLAFLAESHKKPTKMGPWHFELSPKEALKIFTERF